MIPEILRDGTTIIKNHTIKTYIFCILLRIIIGLLTMTDNLSVLIIQLLSIFVIIFFTYKFIKVSNIWKVYLRTILAYSVILLLSFLYGDKYMNICGLLIIVDALMGLQSYYVFDKIGFLIDSLHLN